LEKFIDSRPDGCSNRTIEFYRYTLTHFVGYALNPDEVNAYLKSLTCHNGKVRFFHALKTLFFWLYNNSYIHDKVIDKVPAPKIQKKLLPAVSKEQLEVLIKHCRCERDGALISFLWHSGVRLSECANVHAKDFDWGEGTVTILGKGNKYRKAIAGNGIIRKWFDVHDSFEISRAGIQTMLKRLTKETGISSNSHSYRRGFCIHNIKSGLSTRVVQNLGGWESISMVEKYSKSLSFEDALQVYKDVNGSYQLPN